MNRSHLLMAVGGLALLALGFGAVVLAHKQGWIGPPPAAGPPPTSPPPGQGAFCREHGVPEAICFICSPGLIETQGLCGEHGVPEALCTRCNRALIPAFQATADWCAEHDLPESQCARCDPGLAAPAPATTPPTSPEERRKAPPRAGCRLHAQRIVLAGPELVGQVGLATTPVVRAPLRDLLEVNAELAYPADRLARLAARAPGTVAEVTADLGQWVEEGQVLAAVDAPELGAARADLASAAALLELRERNYAREVELATNGVGTQRDVLEADTRRAEAQAALSQAEQRLRNLGITAAQVEAVRRGALADLALEVRAPFAGLVVARSAVLGEVVAAGAPLFTIADTRRMWALLDVPERALARVRAGQPVLLTVHALPGETFAGRITWVASAVDPRTRTLAARAEVQNPERRLLANVWGRARVTLTDRDDALLVPREAVQWEGCCNVVFVPDGAQAFRPRKVRLGGATESHVEVLQGLSEGEAVVSTGAFLLKTELQKGSIGAGCCEGEE